jgi:hypothetical protein
MGFSLEPPTLNISSHIWTYDGYAYQSEEEGFEALKTSLAWTWSNGIYDYDYVSKNGSCQTIGVRGLMPTILFPTSDSLP